MEQAEVLMQPQQVGPRKNGVAEHQTDATEQVLLETVGTPKHQLNKTLWLPYNIVRVWPVVHMVLPSFCALSA